MYIFHPAFLRFFNVPLLACAPLASSPVNRLFHSFGFCSHHLLLFSGPFFDTGALCFRLLGDETTQNDRCGVDGTCEGVDPCLAVTCNESIDPCLFQPVCRLGTMRLRVRLCSLLQAQQQALLATTDGTARCVPNTRPPLSFSRCDPVPSPLMCLDCLDAAPSTPSPPLANQVCAWTRSPSPTARCAQTLATTLAPFPSAQRASVSRVCLCLMARSATTATTVRNSGGLCDACTGDLY